MAVVAGDSVIEIVMVVCVAVDEAILQAALPRPSAPFNSNKDPPTVTAVPMTPTGVVKLLLF